MLTKPLIISVGLDNYIDCVMVNNTLFLVAILDIKHVIKEYLFDFLSEIKNFCKNGYHCKQS